MRKPDEIPEIPAGLKRGKDNKSELTKKAVGKEPKPVEVHPPEPNTSLVSEVAKLLTSPTVTPSKATSKPPKAVAGVDEFGIRLGTNKSKAAAMYAAGDGATLNEVKMALGQIHFNVLKQLTDKGFKVDKTQEGDKRKITRYKLYPK